MSIITTTILVAASGFADADIVCFLFKTPSTTTRSISNVSKLKGPRPQSSHSYKERKSSSERKERKERRHSGEGSVEGLEPSGTVVKRHRVKSSHGVGLQAGDFFS